MGCMNPDGVLNLFDKMIFVEQKEDNGVTSGNAFWMSDVRDKVLELKDWFENNDGHWMGKHIKEKLDDVFGEELSFTGGSTNG